MWEALNVWAKQDFRSLNGQIEFLLHKALQEKKRLKKMNASNKED